MNRLFKAISVVLFSLSLAFVVVSIAATILTTIGARGARAAAQPACGVHEEEGMPYCQMGKPSCPYPPKCDWNIDRTDCSCQ